jgi:hypothetical protein
MGLRSLGMRLTVSLIATVALLTFGLASGAQAGQSPGSSRPQAPCNPPTCPQKTWKLSKDGKPHNVNGKWRDCAKVSPTPGFNKSYTCSFTGTVGNTYSVSVGISANIVSATVGYSVTYSTGITGGVTYTPLNQKKTRGEVQWASQYSAQKLREKLYIGGVYIETLYGYAYHWIQPVTQFVPSGKIILVSETKGKWGHKHWKCSKRCP